MISSRISSGISWKTLQKSAEDHGQDSLDDFCTNPSVVQDHSRNLSRIYLEFSAGIRPSFRHKSVGDLLKVMHQGSFREYAWDFSRNSFSISSGIRPGFFKDQSKNPLRIPSRASTGIHPRIHPGFFMDLFRNPLRIFPRICRWSFRKALLNISRIWIRSEFTQFVQDFLQESIQRLSKISTRIRTVFCRGSVQDAVGYFLSKFAGISPKIRRWSRQKSYEDFSESRCMSTEIHPSFVRECIQHFYSMNLP